MDCVWCGSEEVKGAVKDCGWVLPVGGAPDSAISSGMTGGIHP